MSEKKKRKEIDNERVSSVSLQRNKDRTVIQGLYNWDPLFIPLFYDIFISVTQSQGYLGGGGGRFSPPNFFTEKMFLFNKYQAHAVSQVPVILHLIQVEVFSEISH